MKAHSLEYPVGILCRVLRLSRSGYYAWLDRPESKRTRKNRRLLVEIRAVHRKSRKALGSPRITRVLKTRGDQVNHKRIARLMREDGIRSVHRRKFRVTTESNHSLPVAPNLLERDFKAAEPNRKWVADITYLRTDEGWLYLAAVMDLHSRRIVGWSLKNRLTEDLALDALRMASKRRNPPPRAVHHSDRGSQYASQAYRGGVPKSVEKLT